VLKPWLGKASREEAARELGVPALRFWQLSQQALAGLVAGCLTQPRFRGRVRLDTGEEATAVELKRRIHVLEREVEAGRRLIELLRELPGHRAPPAAPAREVRRGRPKHRQTDPGATPSAGSAPGRATEG
jgi:hypothetical protein